MNFFTAIFTSKKRAEEQERAAREELKRAREARSKQAEAIRDALDDLMKTAAKKYGDAE